MTYKSYSFADLSLQQFYILSLLFNGLSKKEISKELNMPGGNLNRQFFDIRQKLNVEDDTQIITKATDENWLVPVASLRFTRF